MMKKSIVFLLITALLMSFCAAAMGENIPEPGLKEALKRAQEFNEWMSARTDDEIAAEMGVSRWDVLSPYGTEAPPEPLITVSENDTWENIRMENPGSTETVSSAVCASGGGATSILAAHSIARPTTPRE